MAKGKPVKKVADKKKPASRGKTKATGRPAGRSRSGGSLKAYHEKRRFDRTPEPVGKVTPGRGPLTFCVQKHAATHLHYDFRLELDGVLKSWAVPKGPSLDPVEKRLAVQVEDHPLDYGSFEGTIPQGEYGGGTVMLWDRGYWMPLGDAHAGLAEGKMKFVLDGEKLKGGWMLIRRGGSKPREGERNWFLFKERDEYARPSEQFSVAEEWPLSVKTSRDLDEIAAGKKPKAARKKKTPARRKSTARR